MRVLIFVAVLLFMVPARDCSPINLALNEEDQQKGKDILESIIEANERIVSDENKHLFEGDIKVTSHDNVDQRETGDVDGPITGAQTKRGAVARERKRLWKNKIVPYEITVPQNYKTQIQAAIAEFHKQTCLRFVPHTKEDNWIKFVHKSGCWSTVGVKYWRNGSQEVSLGPGCNHKGVIMHELLHALGFWHEQSRPDRNQYVEVLWENIKKGKAHNFNKYSHGTIDTIKATYDLQSIMHYGNNAFSKNGKPTLQGIGSNKNTQLGQRKGFTKTDIFEINALYDCSGTSKGWSSWSDFGPCSSNCYKVRQRFCTASDKASCPGANSHGVNKQTKKCIRTECYAPVDGHWGRWSSWSQCSVTCGSGSHTRTRLCDDPTPKNGGKQCVGNSKDAGKCERKRCELGPDDCEFEVDMCSWTIVREAKSHYTWYRHTGKTSSSNTGPNGDVSKYKGGKGYYVYAESSSPVKPGEVTKLQSKVFPAAPKGRCFQFAFSMYGSNIGALNIYIIDDKNSAKSKIFSKTGNQGKGWHRTKTTIVSSHDYKISFEATRGKGYRGDIALDDIMFKDGDCQGIPGTTTLAPATSKPTTSKKSTTAKKSTTSRPTTMTTKKTTPTKMTTTKTTPTKMTTTKTTPTKMTTTKTTPTKMTTTKTTPTKMTTTSKPTTTKTTPRPGSSLDCDFERDICRWSARRGTNKENWKINANKTKSSATGPNGDHTTGKGYYVYMETSCQTGKEQTAYLVSPILPPSNAHCLSFYYHMYGRDMGSLNVYIQNPRNQAKFLVSTVSGNQGNVWHNKKVMVASTCRYMVVFEGVRGSSYLSDIALDDILFTSGPCS